MSTYRVGNHQPQNVYRDDAYIGVMFTAEDAALVVEALNAVEREHGPALPIRIEVADRCADEWQSTHEAGSRPNMCATCAGLRDLRLCSRAGSGQGSRLCDGSGRTCPRHGAVI